MVWLGVLLTLASLVLWVYAFFDALTSPAQEVRNLPKFVWVVAILLLMHVGALLWLFFGRPRALAATGPAPGSAPSAEDLNPEDFAGPASRGGPVGPEDDPEFLRKLNKRINPDD